MTAELALLILTAGPSLIAAAIFAWAGFTGRM